MTIDRRHTRVLHLIATNFVGGPEKQILNHLACLDRERYQVHAGSFLEKSGPNEFLERAGELEVPVCPIPERFPFDPAALLFLKGYLKREGIQVLVTHGYKPNILGRLATWGTPVAQAMYVRGWTAENRKVLLYNWLDRKFLHQADLVVTVAQRKAGELLGLGLPEQRIRCIRNAALAPVLQEPDAPLSSFFQGEPPAPLFIAAGRISPEKGQIHLVHAMKLLREKGMNPGCVVFGEGPDQQLVQQEIQNLGLGENLILAGFNAHWKNWIPEADFVINPSLSEVMPNVVLESMITGCPVIATDVGGVRELIPDGSLGWCVPAGNPEALAGAVEDYLARQAERPALVEKARRHVMQHFTFPGQAEQLHALYDELSVL